MLDKPAHAGFIAGTTSPLRNHDRNESEAGAEVPSRSDEQSNAGLQSALPLITILLRPKCAQLLRRRLNAEACAAIDKGRPLCEKPNRLVIKTVARESAFLQGRWDIASKESAAVDGELRDQWEFCVTGGEEGEDLGGGGMGLEEELL